MSTPRGEGSSRSADAFDGSTQLDSASGPIEGFSKLGAKISCLACRAAKRKCSSVDPDTICKRCSTHKIPCEYKRHRRGRKKKAPDASQWPAPTFNAPSTVQSARLAPSAPPFYPSIASTSAVTLDGPAVGCARSQAPPGLSQDQPVAPASYTLPVPPPLGGRRVDIQFSHVVPTGDSMPFVAGALNAAPPPAAGPFLPTDCPDPVHAGILTERDAIDLFKTYFSTMNLVVPVLDPALHSPDWVRHKSALLFTAVITVTAKAERPKAYHACVLLSNKLVGQAVEFGLSTIEVVQSLLLLTHWKQPNDSSSWRKVGYAIRMAQELRLHVRAPRPLPEDEHQAREVLNKERAWLNLVVADYHLAIHHSLPRMISEEDVDDPADWVLEHADKLPCPGESTLPPWITFSRLCRQYADTLADMTGDPANTRSLKWLENDWRRWRSRWLGVKPGLAFLPPQISALRLCDAFFRFHIAEWKLLWVARYSKDRVLHVDEPSELSSTFCECVDASLALAAVFQNDFVVPGYLSFCFNLSYVALAVVSVWLVKNIVAMSSSDRDRVIRTLNEVRSSTEDASRTSDDMSGFTHRLISHLLSTVSPAWQLSSLAAVPSPQDRLEPPSASASSDPPRAATAALERQAACAHVQSSTSTQYDHSAAAPEPTPHSAHYLHLDRLADADTSSCAAFPWSLATQQIIQENLYAPHLHGAASTGTSGQGLGGGPPFDNGVGAQDAFFEPGSAPMSQDDMLFPAADDDIWRLLFPITDTYPA